MPDRTLSSSGKLLSALAVLVAIGLTPVEQWPLLVAILAIAWAALSLAGVPGRTLRRRLAQFAPLVLGLALAAGFSQPGRDAGLWIAATTLRCLAALMVGLWLMHSLSAREFLRLLSSWRVPATLVTTISFMLRHLVVLWEEHERLRGAQLSRAGGPAPGWPTWHAAIERLGLIVVRALDRAERSHRAMLARGWNGTATWKE
jgi:cobalt/nickel transport system permease protein